MPVQLLLQITKGVAEIVATTGYMLLWGHRLVRLRLLIRQLEPGIARFSDFSREKFGLSCEVFHFNTPYGLSKKMSANQLLMWSDSFISQMRKLRPH